jgi:hypothetical protein
MLFIYVSNLISAIGLQKQKDFKLFSYKDK